MTTSLTLCHVNLHVLIIIIITLGYLDDVTLGGDQGHVVKDVHRVIEVGHKMGLTLMLANVNLLQTHTLQ